MRFLVCALLLLVGCTKAGTTTPPLLGGGYDYLVIPSGHMFRILNKGPMIGGQGKKIATVVSYAAETRQVALIVRDAEEIVGALGPEMELLGETSLAVQANVGYDPRKIVSTHVSYNVVFELNAGRWMRLPPKKDDPKELGGSGALVQPPEDPAFPYDSEGTKAAAAAAAKWVALVDAGDASASVAAMSEAFQSQIKGSMDRWLALLAERRKSGLGKRTELYRMQTRTGNMPIPAGGAVVVQYDLREEQSRRFLERVILFSEQGTWRPAGYWGNPFRPPTK